ncbi:MAG: hypothetical protein H0V44_06140, partial [Planctomycetes bacterium]|nr:hypothetical protein [Planctomycetota bacterium]
FCRKVVQHHGGRIWAETNPAGGTIFNFTLGENGALGDQHRTQSLTETGA